MLISRMQANADQVERDILETQKKLQQVRRGVGDREQNVGAWEGHCHSLACPPPAMVKMGQRTLVFTGRSPNAVGKTAQHFSAGLLTWGVQGARGPRPTLRP